MPDQEPIPPPPSPGPELGPKSTSTGLPSNVAAALACIPLIGGIIFYIVEKHDSFVRFYAMQSIIFGVAWILIQIGCGIVSGLFWALPGVGWFFGPFWALIWWLINLALFVLFVVTVVKAFTNVRWEIPYVGPIARKQIEGAV
ncbi:MAG TPA: hypothetical protein VGM65_02995 [Candidatus Udaeobacter sp.]|jgi:uncharacterized membrane protein